VEAVPDNVIEDAVHSVPDDLLDREDKEDYIAFIKHRRTRVRHLVEGQPEAFPNLRRDGA
jgi:hypothetical protein